MSACISAHGEYSEHATNEDLWCARCYQYDTGAVDAAVIELNILRARDTTLRALIEKWRAEERHTGIVAGSYAAGRIDSADELERAMGALPFEVGT